MSHELTTRQDGFVEMAYAEGVDRWHGLGNELRHGASIEEWQVASGTDWLIRRTPAYYYADRAGTDLRAWADKTVLVRSDTGAPLGMVSPDYKIVQPYEMLEFFRDLVATHGFELETAGTLFGGAQFWALAKTTEVIINGWDKIGGRLLVNSSADGSRATTARDTTVCVVCNNTLSAALSNSSKRVVSVRHREDFDIKRVHEQLGLSVENFMHFAEAANNLSTIKVSAAAADHFVQTLLKAASSKKAVAGDDEDTDEVVTDDAKSRKPRGMDLVLELFNGAGLGSTQPGRAGTAWGLVNAVTEYVDHISTAKTESHRMNRAWFGAGDTLKTMALEKALIELA